MGGAAVTNVEVPPWVALRGRDNSPPSLLGAAASAVRRAPRSSFAADWFARRHMRVFDTAFEIAVDLVKFVLFVAAFGLCVSVGASQITSTIIALAWFAPRRVLRAIPVVRAVVAGLIKFVSARKS